MRTWMISAASGPTISMPSTLSDSGSTSIFIKALPALPDMVFFMGLRTAPTTPESRATQVGAVAVNFVAQTTL